MRWSYLWYAGILALGVTTGLGARQFAAPLGLPTPGSPEDKLILQSLGKDIDRLDIVRSLRKQSFNLHSDTPIALSGSGDKSKVKGWVEVDVDFAKGEEAEGRTGILGAMSGTRGLGVQRAFWNADTREMVAVVWIGGGLAGWPGVGHGGAIATIFEETMARMVRGPVGTVGTYNQAFCFPVGCAKPSFRLTVELTRSMCRVHPPPNLYKCDVRETNIYPRLLRPPRRVLAAKPTTNRASSRTRSGTHKKLAGLAITKEGSDEED